MYYKIKVVALVMLVSLSCLAIASPVLVGNFSSKGIKDWNPKSFVGETAYKLEKENGKTIIKAQSHASASGLFYEKKIDIKKTPWVNWRWKVAGKLPATDEQSKSGDDYVARIYIVKDGGVFFWKTKALNYVWSSSQASGSKWDNAYTGNAKMIAVQGKDDEVGIWVENKRNVLSDLEAAFGESITEIDAIAIMTDTDNTQASATAWYGDIYFSEH